MWRITKKSNNSKDRFKLPLIQHRMMHKIIQRLTIQGISISRINTKDALDLPEVTFKLSLLIAEDVIIPHTKGIMGDQKGCHLSIRLRSCRDHSIQSFIGIQQGHPTLKKCSINKRAILFINQEGFCDHCCKYYFPSKRYMKGRLHFLDKQLTRRYGKRIYPFKNYVYC